MYKRTCPLKRSKSDSNITKQYHRIIPLVYRGIIFMCIIFGYMFMGTAHKRWAELGLGLLPSSCSCQTPGNLVGTRAGLSIPSLLYLFRPRGKKGVLGDLRASSTPPQNLHLCLLLFSSPFSPPAITEGKRDWGAESGAARYFIHLQHQPGSAEGGCSVLKHFGQGMAQGMYIVAQLECFLFEMLLSAFHLETFLAGQSAPLDPDEPIQQTHWVRGSLMQV